MTETPQPTKFCVNCKHHAKSEGADVCKRTYTDNPVTGYRKYVELDCNDQREVAMAGKVDVCGFAGRYFEAKPSVGSFYDR